MSVIGLVTFFLNIPFLLKRVFNVFHVTMKAELFKVCIENSLELVNNIIM